MSRGDDDSRPRHEESSKRNTARDVPAAKFKDGSVGTVAPRGLRGPSLLPGQGAPERINPEEVELAVLRDAETLDGPHLARAGQRRLPDPRSPSPTPVSVEVPRVRSIPPANEYPSTPPSPSARSIQSGTLMSIGSVDPRAPTELSLPSPAPRALSFSERALYLGPEAVVDRTPATSPRELPGVAESDRFDPTLRPGAPRSEPRPNSSARGAQSAGAISSVRPSREPESVAPPAQKFVAAARPHAPLTPRPASVRESRPELASSRRPAPRSGGEVPPQFQIHSDLDAVRHELRDDTFDLRSASTQREPLASRKPLPSSDWTPHGPPSHAASRTSDPGARSNRHSVPDAFPTTHDTAPPTTDRVAPVPPQRASVPLSWVLGGAGLAVLLALIVAWVMRSPSVSRESESVGTRATDGRGSMAAPSPALQSAADTSAQVQHGAPSSAAAASATGLRSPIATKASGTRLQPSASAQAASKLPTVTPTPVDSADPNSKVHQSIY